MMKSTVKGNAPVRKIVAYRFKNNGAIIFPSEAVGGCSVLTTNGEIRVGEIAFDKILDGVKSYYEPIYQGDTVEITF